jgi:hypothetical protein
MLPAVRSRSGPAITSDFTSASGTPVVVDKDTGDAYVLKADGSIVNLKSDIVSIKDFGAVGDDSTDNTGAIQDAIDSLTSGTVLVPKGTFQCGQIALKSNVSIEGAGWGSILKLKNSGNNYLLANTNGAQYIDNVAIRNLAIDGNKANNTSGGGIAMNGRNFELSGCYIHDTANACLNFGASSNGATNTPLSGNVRIVNNYCKNASLSGAAWGALAVTHGSNVVISGNVVESTDGFQTYGIDVEPNSNNIIDNILISGNVVKGGRIFADCGEMVSPGTNISILDNRVDARGSDGATVVNIAPLYVRNVTGFIATGNYLIGHDSGIRGGIHVQGSLTSFKISDNYIVPSQPASGNGYGIHFNNVASCAVDGEVSDNTLIAAETVSYGIYAFHATGLVNVKIGTNFFKNFTVEYAVVNAPVSIASQFNPAVSADNGDAAKTLSHMTAEGTQLWNTPLTAARAVSLNRSVDEPMGLIGQKFRIVRGAGATGAFNLNVGTGPLKALTAAGQWCDVECEGSTWRLTASGSL